MASEAHGAEEGGLVFHPMDQFIVKPLIGDTIAWYTPTNVTLWMFLAVLAISAALEQTRSGDASREAVLHRLATTAGVYVPAFYDIAYEPDGRIAASEWFSSNRSVPPASPIASGSSSRPYSTRRSSSSRNATRAK